MGFSSLQILLLLINAIILTMQELVTLNVSPVIRAACGQQVTLTCNVSSSRHGLSIKHLAWIKNNKSLCGVNSEGKLTKHQRHTLSDFHCEYEQGRLSLIFQKVQPVESGASADYMCKLHSNHGLPNKHARVELQDCCGNVQVGATPESPSCTFTEIHPGADVHWFLNSRNLTGGPLRSNTSKRREEGGWMTIHSSLEKKDLDQPYNCSLWCATSGQYITSSLIPGYRKVRSGTAEQTPMRTFLFCVSFTALLAAIMK